MLFLVKNLKAHYSGDRMEEYVILVDQNDNPIGKEEKVKCHLPNGKLHRAFSALIFNRVFECPVNYTKIDPNLNFLNFWNPFFFLS